MVTDLHAGSLGTLDVQGLDFAIIGLVHLDDRGNKNEIKSLTWTS